jgi:diguanylate cyclase (GGDEF)-like protein
VAAYIALCTACTAATLTTTGVVWQNLGTAAYVGALFLFAPPYPMIIALVAAMVSQVAVHDLELVKRAFNVSHPALTVGLTSAICSPFFRPYELVHRDFLTVLPEILLVAGVFYLLDVGKMLCLLLLLRQGTPQQIWRQTFRYTLLPEMGSSSIGVLAAIICTYNVSALVLLVLPVVAMRAAIKANTRAEERAEALRRRGNQLEAVLALGQYLRLQLSRMDLLQAVAEAARAILDAEVVTGYLRDEADPDVLRRAVVAPIDAVSWGADQLAAAACAAPDSSQELRMTIEPDGKGVAAMLVASGSLRSVGSADRDVLAILTAQATIAMQNAYLHERALELAALDSLTNLLNRRAVESRLEEELARASRRGLPTTVLMIDLDDFSTINDTFGHGSGDSVLRTVAQALAGSVRAMDVIARYGGDEFLAVLPETTIDQGVEVAQRIVDSTAALQIVEGPISISLTASVGVAALPEHGESLKELLRQADQAAYAAKHAGKGRVARPEDAMLALDRDPVALAKQLTNANMATLATLAVAVDAKDPYTQGHSQRVASYAAALAKELQLAGPEIARIQLAGQLHDVGKIGVSDVILKKPGALTAEEYEAIKEHPVIGERMLSAVPFLKDILPAVRHHHERWDGRGYPDGLRAHQIPIEAAILAVADAFDSMTTDRPYRSSLPIAEAMRRIHEGSVTQFCPMVVVALEQAVASGAIAAADASWLSPSNEVIERAG